MTQGTYDAKLFAAANLTKRELRIINETTESLLEERPLVLLATAAHIMGTFIRASDGVFKRKRAVQVMDRLIQL